MYCIPLSQVIRICWNICIGFEIEELNPIISDFIIGVQDKPNSHDNFYFS